MRTRSEDPKKTSAGPRSAGSGVCFSEIISALSLALDLTEGAVQGHALRSCLLGMRIAAKLAFDAPELRSLYYALLLKDVGCSSNAARMCQIVGGDDRAVKSAAKLEDWTKTNKPKLSMLKMLWGNVLPEAGVADRFVRIVQIGLAQNKNNEELITLRCDRGASIVKKLGLGEAVADAVRHLDEHWDGSGYPERFIGSRTPIFSRVMLVAQHLDVFSTERGPQKAIDVLLERSGTWFDPDLAQIASSLHRQGALWGDCLRDSDPEQTRRAVLELEPGEHIQLAADEIDQVCEAFADVVDAKSPFTYRHSIGVATAALGIAQTLGLAEERVRFIRRAALLHDLGKLNVSNTILDKPGKPTEAEWRAIREHPAISRRILERVAAFDEIAVVAGQHHEKLDGSGYPDGITAEKLCLEARIIAVADVYGALSEDRPYRESLSLDTIVGIMSKDIPNKLDGDCFEALLAYVDRRDREKSAQSVPVCEPSGLAIGSLFTNSNLTGFGSRG
jgi:putative nucleotidyltransferase with HDIG domain